MNLHVFSITELLIFPFINNVICIFLHQNKFYLFKIVIIFVFLKMLLGKITWPVEDSDDEDFDLETTCRITGFLRMFIEKGKHLIWLMYCSLYKCFYVSWIDMINLSQTKCCLESILWLVASSGTLAQLLTFWIGWEMLPPELRVEISGGTHPTSSTCFETLKLPAHFKTYTDFEKALVSAINSAQTGFGMV